MRYRVHILILGIFELWRRIWAICYFADLLRIYYEESKRDKQILLLEDWNDSDSNIFLISTIIPVKLIGVIKVQLLSLLIL